MGMDPPHEFLRTLNKLRETEHAMDLLRFLNEQVMREQEIYWQRFYAFATLQAGAFLLTTSPAVGKSKALALGALFLAVVWTWVQGLSLGYTNRLKRRYHDFRRWLDIPFESEEQRSPKGHRRAARLWRAAKATLQNSSASSSTDIGVWVTILVAAFWVYYFFSYVYVTGMAQASLTTQQALPDHTGWLTSLARFVLSGFAGALTSLLVAWYYDRAVSPRLEILADDTPRQTGQQPGSARHQFLQIKVNQAKGGWPFLSRRAALNCRAILDVLNADGSRAIERRITARWSGSLQPYRTQVVGKELAQIPDTSLLPLGQRFDVHSYADEQVGIAVKFEGGEDCWIFSNESYLFNGRHKPGGKLSRGRYYLRCDVYYEASKPATQWFLLSNGGAGFDGWSIELADRGPQPGQGV